LPRRPFDGQSQVLDPSRKDEGKIVVQKFADEGTGTPFVARILYGQMKLAEALGAADQKAMLKAHKPLMTAVMESEDDP
jgi:hypothetical protein